MFRILIVDDDPQFRRTLHLTLDSCGYQVTEASGGKEALDAIAASDPDLIVLDWRLPDLDGLQTCRALRVHSDRPVIMVSGDRSKAKAVALNAGANDYLAKPFSINELVSCIEAALKY